MTNNLFWRFITMKKIIFIFTILCTINMGLAAQGLRYSVCVVEPEFTESERTLMGDYSLFMARAGIRDASRALGAYKNEGCFGSGVVIAHDGKKYILTNLHVVGYAQTATIRFMLHDKVVRYTQCRVINISPTCDLALVDLPQECEMIPLELCQTEPTEELSIAAAGFPELANKPSWQLTRGYISNAKLEADEKNHAIRIIQHTASIDPGSSGGPLLVKQQDNTYQILGINTWKAFYRDGVGLAIGKEDIITFLNSPIAHSSVENKTFNKLEQTSGEEWLYIFRKLSENTQESIREMDWRLPLEPAVRTLALRDSLQNSDKKSAKKFERSESVIVSDMEHNWIVRFRYENFLNSNHQITAQFGVDWHGFVPMGLQVSPIILQCKNADNLTPNPAIQTRFGLMFGAFIGGQIPFAVGKQMLIPSIVQSAGGGPLFGKDFTGGFAITTDTRIGLDWRIPFDRCDLIIGIHYDMNWLWTKAQLNQKIYKASTLSQYLQHGIGISLGLGF